jgi:hypothetical protein
MVAVSANGGANNPDAYTFVQQMKKIFGNFEEIQNIEEWYVSAYAFLDDSKAKCERVTVTLPSLTRINDCSLSSIIDTATWLQVGLCGERLDNGCIPKAMVQL